MSSTSLINQAVAEQRHASERQQSQSLQQRGGTVAVGFEQAHQNVGSAERTISLIAGAILVGLGLSRGGLVSLGMGGALIFRGATGHCGVYQALGVDTSEAQ